MKEDFLHYLWRYKKFTLTNLQTTQGEYITIINVGQYLQLSGPDFFNAQIIIGNQKWAGNVEIHLKSSDWYVHNHENDEAYENVIIHVVWEDDMAVFRKNNSEVPVLQLKEYVSQEMIKNYTTLSITKKWIYCEEELKKINNFIINNWQERLFFERLERKAIDIEQELRRTDNDWEAVLFYALSKNFGLNTNGEQFLKMAQSIPFTVIRKERFDILNLEALFFGRIGLLLFPKEDQYYNNLKKRFEYLQEKYQLKKIHIDSVQFFKHRPDNFPTIRLSQLASVYHSQDNLFSKIIKCHNIEELYSIFEVTTSAYWQSHYLFDRSSTWKKKKISKNFIHLIIINTIIPIQFAYAKYRGKDAAEEIIKFLKEVPPEVNVIIDKFSRYGIKSKNAFETQALIQLKKEYCNHRRCLNCAIGMKLMTG
ncbi:DUF2851 family protein [Flavobacterium sp. '19STA2R22 D10 B1']|uniref:DUF2851 family protein n=1 Tax=Flavobacterium aerium TaxID=3037261 RepID=UPI00278BD0B0|nr:DUF2851 family protein [Flavobacterium sp. '19STA2R22 D10 B1']